MFNTVTAQKQIEF